MTPRTLSRVVALAGATESGVGRPTALSFAQAGDHVIAIDSDAAALEALRAEAESLGGSLNTILGEPHLEVTLTDAAAHIAAKWGHLDVLVTCYLHAEMRSIEASDDAHWLRSTEINFLGPVRSARAFLPLLRNGTDPAIVHVGSIDGVLGNPQIPAYSATKGALIPLTHVMAEEFGPYGIRVNTVLRAAVADGSPAASLLGQTLAPVTPLGRIAQPHEVADAIRYLASPQASFVTGATLPLDGGRIGITPGTALPRS